MCGIAGYVLSDKSQATTGQVLVAMAKAIRHRGPDDEGFALAQSRTGQLLELAGTERRPEIGGRLRAVQSTEFVHDVGLAHRRYSIIDLSPSGHQPMRSSDGSICLTFNGEIYNYVELRQELVGRGFEFRTKSDTEVLLAGYVAWGEAVFERANGFFALALYDTRRRAVLLARDRLGKAHLYYVERPDGSLFWASEIKALMAADCFDVNNIEDSAVSDFILHDWRDRSGTFWKDVRDFPPAHFAWVTRDTALAPKRYWDFPKTRLTASDLSLGEASDGLSAALCDALRIRLRADVPIAYELSGGMDSSALVGLTAGCLGKQLRTFTVEFPQQHSNEEPFARAVAERYPELIDYRVIHQPHASFWKDAHEFVWLQEEPFHAPNLHTNQYLRRAMKAEGAHVVITGSAGDELLAGYPHDYLVPYMRHLLLTGSWGRFATELRRNTELAPGTVLRTLVSRELLDEESRAKNGQRRRGELDLLQRVMPGKLLGMRSRRPSGAAEKSFHGMTIANLTYRRMNYWLRSGAKSNYGIPIEARAPFLDYKVVEYACSLPPEYLIRGGWHKYVLREAVQQYLPEQVTWRRNKMGFPFPYREWLIASRSIVAKNVEDLSCPHIDGREMLRLYEQFVKVAPTTLWRLVSVLLWWRRVIEGRFLHAT